MPRRQDAAVCCDGSLNLEQKRTTKGVRLGDSHITLNPSQRQHLLITCKHIDKLMGDVEETLNAAASKSVFPNYVSDITPLQRKTIEDYIARVRGQLLQVLAGQSLAPEKPRISEPLIPSMSISRSSRLPLRNSRRTTCGDMALCRRRGQPI